MEIRRPFENEPERQEFRTALDSGVALFKTAAADRSVRDRVLQIDINTLLQCYLNLGDMTEEVTTRALKELAGGPLDPAVMRSIVPKIKTDRVLLGSYFNPMNLRRDPAKRYPTLFPAEVAKEWERLWLLDPTDPYLLQMLLAISRQNRQGNHSRDFWIHEAVLADPSSYAIAKEALTQLRWAELSFEDVQEFADQCAASGDYRSHIPFLYVERMVEFSRRKSNDEDGKPDSEYLTQPQYWEPIASVYEAYLTRFPLDTGRRSEYASLACLTGHWPLAAQQFKILGNRVKPKAFYTQERLDACRAKIETLMGKGFLPAPPAVEQ